MGGPPQMARTGSVTMPPPTPSSQPLSAKRTTLSSHLRKGTRHTLSAGTPTWRRPSRRQLHRDSLTWTAPTMASRWA
uniref:L3MBTL histone methyl-lysine binding protein 2 n=1 Tax=Molossus molossus TaxID=27622 RepID=A0A7J8FYF4_MOLMO|nr:L3MBTL histone methyl-lysine binding protein 2 [Molossus molossus]